jgi:hypothetical protein
MMFTKEYIELCKNEKVQGLKSKLKYGDWFAENDSRGYVGIVENEVRHNEFLYQDRNSIYWLPTGDQLDEEIVKICREKGTREYCYSTKFYPNSVSVKAKINNDIYDYHEGNNPLIAKIKLLIKLLEE